jgi:HK97 family phage major capsid protein
MNKKDKLQAAINADLAQWEAINALAETENRDFTDDELKAIDDLTASVAANQKQLSALDSFDAVKASISAPRRKVIVPDGVVESFDAVQEDTIPARAKNHGKLKAFDDDRTAYRAYQWFCASKLNHQPSIDWCQRNHVDLSAANMVEGTDSAGGALVPTEFVPALVKNVTSYGVFRQYAKNIPMSRDVAEYPVNSGGLTFSFPGEATATSGLSKDTYAKATLTAKACAADVPISRELIADAAISVIDDVFDSAARGLALAQDTQGFLGTGSPFTGVATRLATETVPGTWDYEPSVVETTGHFATLDLADFVSLSAALPYYAGSDEPKLFISKSGFNQWIDALTLGAGGNTAATLAAKSSRMFNGFEVVFTEVLPKASDTISAGDVLALFGHLDRACAFGDREALNFNVSEHYRANTREISVFPWARFACNTHDTGSDTVAGPIIALIFTGS